jgi:hypothetical protein
MSSTIEQYREAKNNYLKLKNQAKKQLVTRFNELANELLQLQRELLEDFGHKVTIPTKPKKTSASKPVSKPVAKEEKSAPAKTAPPPPSPKLLELQKLLGREKNKLTRLQAAGKPTKATDDRIYELEDEIRLQQSK